MRRQLWDRAVAVGAAQEEEAARAAGAEWDDEGGGSEGSEGGGGEGAGEGEGAAPGAGVGAAAPQPQSSLLMYAPPTRPGASGGPSPPAPGLATAGSAPGPLLASHPSVGTVGTAATGAPSGGPEDDGTGSVADSAMGWALSGPLSSPHGLGGAHSVGSVGGAGGLHHQASDLDSARNVPTGACAGGGQLALKC